MKIGIHYSTYNDVAYLLQTLMYSEIIHVDDHKFTLRYNDDEYYFCSSAQTFDAEMLSCDRKIKLEHNRLYKRFNWRSATFEPLDNGNYDKLILTTPGEAFDSREVSDKLLYNLLDTKKVMIYSGCSILDFYHENFIYNPWKNFYYFYNLYGFKFLNFYKNHKHKKNLLGVYHKWENGHTLPGRDPRTHRNNLVNIINTNYPNTLHRYGSNESTLDIILNAYTNFGQWEQTHSTTYTDYSTSTCNLVWETRVAAGRYYFSEKTLKAVLFSGEGLFFMWLGAEFLYRKLKNHGFWFLNFEFINDECTYINDFCDGHPVFKIGETYPETEIDRSIIRTTEFLVKLKEKYKTNENVYEYLLEKYGHHLEKNYSLFKEILFTCDEKDKVLNFLKD